ncbi:MAG: membrane protein insertase YidC [Anaerolineales bacterium]|nr:membrane protein insertase YidC [Anaerolineales bacterium]
MWDYFVGLMIQLLLFIYDIFGNNFGLAIILFTILTRLLTYPLNAQQMKSTQAMQDLQKSKEWEEIQKKYKNDREKLAQEQMRLYKEMGVNPFGSCLPTLIQLPIIFALYQAIIRTLAVTPVQLLTLSNHISTSQAALIPLNSKFLWMELSQPERLYIFGIGIPFLAIVVALTSYVQTKVMTPPSGSSPNDQGAAMTRAMGLYMPLFMGWLAYSFSSGLALYFVVSNLASIFQYAVTGRVDWSQLLPKSMRNSEAGNKKGGKKK